MSKLVIAFCTAQAIGEQAHTENGTWSQSNSRERSLFLIALIHFWKVEVALVIGLYLSQQSAALWQKQLAGALEKSQY